MSRRARSRHSAESGEPVAPAEQLSRSHGPWDAGERPHAEGDGWVDLGALRVRGRPGITLQIPQDDQGATPTVVVVADGGAMELRVFAATKSGGLWEDVRLDLRSEVARLGGEVEETDGPYGPELRVTVPSRGAASQLAGSGRPVAGEPTTGEPTTGEPTTGEPATQTSRIIGIEGPRWLLRVTFLGRPATESGESGPLWETLRDLVVVRGDEARIPREPLVLTVPESARRHQESEPRDGGDDGHPGPVS